METHDKINAYFFNALRAELMAKGQGSVKELAGKVNLSGAFISKISQPSKEDPRFPVKVTPPKRQKEIARACGFEIDDFLEIGKKIFNKSSVLISKNSGVAPKPISGGNGGDRMTEVDSTSKLIGHFESLIEAQERRIEELRSDNDRLRSIEREYLDMLRSKAAKTEGEDAAVGEDQKKTAV